MRDFDRSTLRLVEPLRALRILRYAAWIAQRWRDPAFQRAFPDWDEPRSWQRELTELELQRARVEEALARNQASGQRTDAAARARIDRRVRAAR